MKQEKVTVIKHEEVQGGYRLLELAAPECGPLVAPGQFLHLLIPQLGECVLRRPFSIFKANAKGVSVLYKMVGKGTTAMGHMRPGDEADIIGPLGNGFPDPQPDRFPVLVAGGYGNAALYLQAARSARKGVAFFGGRSAQDILCIREFEKLGWEVCVATEDGTLGTQGRVTDVLLPWLESTDEQPEFFVCGPNGMLKAVGEIALERDLPCWLSMDRNMACGVGACLTCVIRLKDEQASEGWKWARCCKDGPVFAAAEVIWDD